MTETTVQFVPFSEEIFLRHAKQVESFFGTVGDANQVPITINTCRKLVAMHPHSLIYAVDDRGNVFGSICVIPTTKELSRRFVRGVITEKELFDQTPVQAHYGALYLCSIFVVPAYQGKGYAQALVRRAAELLQPDFASADLFSWTVTGKGKRLVKGMEKKYGRKINLRSVPPASKKD
jgi:GNAT superfamily N-acetyltransferase